jgi:hypothetical protein
MYFCRPALLNGHSIVLSDRGVNLPVKSVERKGAITSLLLSMTTGPPVDWARLG